LWSGLDRHRPQQEGGQVAEVGILGRRLTGGAWARLVAGTHRLLGLLVLGFPAVLAGVLTVFLTVFWTAFLAA
jgi:hypothetical protein